MERKEQIRAVYRKRREALEGVQVTAWSKRICDILLEWELFRQARKLCFYYPLGKEADLLIAASQALDQGKQVYFPRTAGGVMDFWQVAGLADFKEGCFHVMEPVSEERLDVSGEAEDVLILTPGVVFDHQKGRMGYGKGYYDRYFANVPGAVKLGIAYQCQVTELIATDVWDVPMDYMITEEGIW